MQKDFKELGPRVMRRLSRHEALDRASIAYWEDGGRPFRHLDVSGFAAPIRQMFIAEADVAQHAYAIRHGACLLEPERGWGLTRRIQLIDESLVYSREIHLPPPQYRRHIPFALHRGRADYETVVSLRHPYELNYFHAFHDVLTKLVLLEQLGVQTSDLPLLISPALYGASWFQEIAAMGSLQTKQWVPHERPVRCETAYLTWPMLGRREDLEGVVAMLDLRLRPRVDDRRIFLFRSRRTGRNIENQLEVETLLGRYGFEPVDADTLTVREQAQLFCETRYLVGTHGAGLFNMVFRGNAPLSLLEFFPPWRITPLYFWIAAAYGFAYDALIGAPGALPVAKTEAAGSLVLDVNELERRVEKLLA